MISLYNIEKKLNIRFPKVYMELYESDFEEIRKIQIQADEDYIIIKKFLKAQEIDEILDEFFDYWGYDIIPVAEAEYGDYICLWYKDNRNEPSIIYWNYELALENPVEGILFLYDSIHELITELK